MGKFNVGDRVYSAKWHTTGVVAEPAAEDKVAFEAYNKIMGINGVYVIHDDTSPHDAGTAGLYFEEELEHA